jgi:predicted alpha/beta superfamily hydrolase
LQPVIGSDTAATEKEIAMIRENTGVDFLLAAFRVNNWNTDLSPWESPAVFGKDGFGGKAAETLQEIENYCKDETKSYYIGGYSLAGLFSLWAAYQNDLFMGVAAASPSVWFPDFTEYMKTHTIRTGKVYLSLGDKEEKVKNPVMATVGDRIRASYELLKEQKINTILEWNEGNHFKETELRTAKAFSWILQQGE